MNHKQEKNKFVKVFGIFIGIVLLLTFLSKSIYNYQLPMIEVALPKQGNLSFTVEELGAFDYKHVDSFYAEIDGRVKEILVSPGDEVEEGQCLMRFQLNGTGEMYDVVAAESGIIASIGVELGMYVSSMQNTVLYKMAEKTDEWICYTIISEEQLKHVNLDSIPVIYIESRDVTVEGKILSIVDYVSQDLSGYKVYISVSLDDAALYGEKAEVRIIDETMVYDTLIPVAALRKDAVGYYVLVLHEEDSVLGEGYVAYRMSVDLLDSDETFCAVRGLPTDEMVIVAATSEITDGSKVYYEGEGIE